MKTLQKSTLGICLFVSMLLFSAKSNAQIKAAISASKSTLSCPTQSVSFTDNSTGNPTLWAWDFGDRTGSTIANPSHQYVKSGRYTVTLIVTDALLQQDTAVTTIVVSGPTVQYSKTIDTTCSNINVKFSSKATGGDPLFYNWDFGDGTTSNLITSSTTHTFRAASTYPVRLTVRDTSGCSVSVADTLTFGAITTTLSSSSGSQSLIANRECTDQYGWTNYYYDNGTPTNWRDDIIVLSIRKNGNNIGTIGDGTFQVKLAATENAGSNHGIVLTNPLVATETGYYAMNRFWNVIPTRQPTSNVGVRFYFNSQDVSDINGTYPEHNATLDQLIFYKAKGGSPDPTTDLNNATEVTSIFYGSFADETHWTYTYTGPASHCAEFVVNGFSGGGAGVTRTIEALPIKLVSFNGKPENNAVKLNWVVTSEINVERFDIEASVDGRTFVTIGRVQAKGNTFSTTDYAFTDSKLNGENVKFYKIVTVDKDGKRSYSEVIRVSVAGVSNSISLYPVPANSYITITSKTIINKTCTVEVFNSLGIKVMQVKKTAPGNSFQVNTANLPNGRYRTIIFNNNDKIGDGNFIILR